MTGVYLPYGVATGGELVHIDQVRRGKTDLACPYCAGLLLAKKPATMSAHFAHVAATCRAARSRAERFSLPAYDRFDLSLPPKVIHALQNRQEPGAMSLLLSWGLVEINQYLAVVRGDGYQYTRKAEVVRGTLSMRLFADWQLQLWAGKLEQLQRDADKAAAAGSIDAPDYAADLRLFEAQKARVASLSLYFLRIGDEGLHKIGVTSRPIEERVAEVAADVHMHLGAQPIKVLDVWPNRGRLERYFLHRYSEQRETIGPLTEYLRFESDDAKAALTDLRRVRKGDA